MIEARAALPVACIGDGQFVTCLDFCGGEAERFVAFDDFKGKLLELEHPLSKVWQH